ncbi:MAG: phasin family protein [Halioglobus sp.]
MSDDKGKVTDKASEIAKNIWLAGVGAYGKAAGEAQDRLEKAGVETPKLFKDLVKAGAALEEEAKDKDKGKDKESPKRTASSSVEERISKVRENFSLTRPSRSDELSSLHAKIDLLSNKLDLLTNTLTDQGVIKVPTTRKKAAAKKPAVKKATAKKTAVKKAPPKKKAAASSRAKTKKRQD